jgi:Zn-dependent metalloprotease
MKVSASGSLSPFQQTIRRSTVISFCLLLSACGGGGGGSSSSNNATEEPTPSVNQPNSNATQIPENTIKSATFRDEQGEAGQISGSISISSTSAIAAAQTASNETEFINLYWADDSQQKIGNSWLSSSTEAPYQLSIPSNTQIPENASGLLLTAANAIGEATENHFIAFHDFTGNTNMTGPGGSELAHWHYGTDRPSIAIERDHTTSTCYLDNGLVQVIDMANTSDTAWEALEDTANTVDENSWPAYSFNCDENPENTEKAIYYSNSTDISSYSRLNDAMYYGTVTYEAFQHYLGEPPLEDKLRLRIHYGTSGLNNAFWDGAYANFGDAQGFAYTLATLDIIAHEIAHGVLGRISAMDAYDTNLTDDAHTIHEAFSDISATMVKYYLTGNDNDWIHGKESNGYIRNLDQIKTESGAIESFLDYQDAGDNYYLRMGMLTYPFYLLSQNWSLETAYQVYLHAARNCWQSDTSLEEAARCINLAASALEQSNEQVIEAFKSVKIQLKDNDALSHFTADKFKLNVEFSDNSQSNNTVTQWQWDFGDGNQSNEQSPYHSYDAAGEYTATLSIEDDQGNTDQFSKTFTVTDQYCPITASSSPHGEITSVILDGSNLNYTAGQSDYTSTVINISDPSNVAINIDGNLIDTEFSTNWQIWIDLNDDGLFSNDESVYNQTVEANQPYQLSAQLDISDLVNENDQPKYMRIVGDYAVITACYQNTDHALDVRIDW